MKAKLLKAFACLLLLAMLLNGCGGTADLPTATPGGTPSSDPSPVLDLTSLPTPQAEVPDGVLPDPYSFFFGDEEVKYRTDLEGGCYIATFYFSAETTGIEEDYITLLREGGYGLTLRDSSSAQSDAFYVFDYTGTADIPSFDLSGKTDMALYISTYVWKTRLEVQIWYAVDGFTFQDFGNRSPLGNLADICIEETTCRQSGGPLSPEKFGGTSSSGSSGSGSSGSSGSSSSGNQATRCTKCHGTGKIECSRCDGSGGKWVYVSGGPNYSGNGQSTSTRKWENCSKCHGSGKVDCTTCGGSGKV